jgi:sugar/nucleoside kinase (ribokinase family)
MKVAILGPICKDYITIDGETKSQIGSIVYYTGMALKNLGVDVSAYATFSLGDKSWIKKQFKGVNLHHIIDDNTLKGLIEYSRKNPDVRITGIKTFAKGIIWPTEELVKELNSFDWIIFAPLLYTNIPFELVSKLSHKNLACGNFGFFTDYENGNYIAKYPEKMISILPFLQYVFLDLNEAAFVSGRKDPRDIAAFFIENKLKNLIITEGSKGSHIFSKEKYYKIDAFSPKKLIDATGAGDSYVAGFIKSLELYNDPKNQGNFAAMVATISLEKSGSFDLATEDVVNRLNEIKQL